MKNSFYLKYSTYSSIFLLGDNFMGHPKDNSKLASAV